MNEWINTASRTVWCWGWSFPKPLAVPILIQSPSPRPCLARTRKAATCKDNSSSVGPPVKEFWILVASMHQPGPVTLTCYLCVCEVACLQFALGDHTRCRCLFDRGGQRDGLNTGAELHKARNLFQPRSLKCHCKVLPDLRPKACQASQHADRKHEASNTKQLSKRDYVLFAAVSDISRSILGCGRDRTCCSSCRRRLMTVRISSGRICSSNMS